MPTATHRCSRCGTDKPVEAFAPHARRASGLQDWCRECIAAYQRDYRQRPEVKARTRADNRERKRLAAEAVWRYLATHPCIDCGEADPVVLEFDHVFGDKIDAISNLARNGATWTAIAAEIEKCVVRCANCHRRKTAVELGWYARLSVITTEGPALPSI